MSRQFDEYDYNSAMEEVTAAELAGIEAQIEALEAQPWTPELNKVMDVLLARRAALGWVNPHATFIRRLVGGK